MGRGNPEFMLKMPSYKPFHKGASCGVPDRSPKPHLIVSEITRGMHSCIHENALPGLAKKLNLTDAQLSERLSQEVASGRLKKRGNMFFAD